MSTATRQPATVTAEMTDSTPLLGDAAAMRRRGEEEGYLLFRGLLPAEALLQVRRELLRVVDRHGLKAAERPDDDGTLNVDALRRVPDAHMRLDIGVPTETYHDVQRLPCVHELPHHPSVLAMLGDLLDGEVLVHPRHIVRMVTPHPAVAPTPVHQDFPLIQGTCRTWTCWIPIGDCPRRLGGLAVLRGSHKKGYLPIQPAIGAGSIAAQLCPHEDDWVSTDYRIGDVLTFPAYTVHKANPCLLPDQIRLSFDVRYQRVDEPVEAKSLLPHCPLSWEEIYRDWQGHDHLKYYWTRRELTAAPWDAALLQPSRRIC